jgi:pyruvate/2-oxoglutarate dehydrogenase complex dihydrolipoamide dehydrogenase (E3) component
MEQLPEVLPIVDPALGRLVHGQLAGHGVEVLTGATVKQITRANAGENGRLRVEAATTGGEPVTRLADMVLVVVGVRCLAWQDFVAAVGTLLEPQPGPTSSESAQAWP